MTKLLGVIGDPISHSLSPLIHNGWLRELGYDATYEALHVPDGQFMVALRTLEQRDVLGLNVTLPHKTSALQAAAEATPAANRIGAANTLTYRGAGDWHADNTDAPGFLSVLEKVNPYTDNIVLLGAGGSARAIVYALSQRNFRVTVLNRTIKRASQLATDLGGKSTAYGSLNQYREYIEAATIVINTTSIGYDGGHLELPDGEGRTFFDISYGKIAAPQIDHAVAKGWNVKDGLSMLVAQAACSFEIWFGEAPDRETAMARCQNALRAIS